MKHAEKTTAAKKPAQTVYELLPEIKPGQSVELLKELHILTRDGKLNQDSRRKLKQVYHLVQFIEPLVNDVLDKAWGLEPVSRLSCQAIVGTEDLVVEIPKYTINHAAEKNH